MTDDKDEFEEWLDVQYFGGEHSWKVVYSKYKQLKSSLRSQIISSYNKELLSDAAVEAFAKLEHEQWIYWSTHIAKMEPISAIRQRNWEQMWVDYAKLPEEIKEHDRKWARKVIEIIAAIKSVEQKEEKVK